MRPPPPAEYTVVTVWSLLPFSVKKRIVCLLGNRSLFKSIAICVCNVCAYYCTTVFWWQLTSICSTQNWRFLSFCWSRLLQSSNVGTKDGPGGSWRAGENQNPPGLEDYDWSQCNVDTCGFPMVHLPLYWCSASGGKCHQLLYLTKKKKKNVFRMTRISSKKLHGTHFIVIRTNCKDRYKY